MEHAREAIERALPGFDVGRPHVVPRNRHAEGGASFAARASRGGKASDAVATMAAVAFREVEGDGGESPAELIFELPVSAADGTNNGPKDPNGFE